MCHSGDNCTDGSSFTVTPQTGGGDVDIEFNSRLVEDSHSRPVRTATGNMTKEEDEMKEFAEIMNKGIDQMVKEFKDLTTEANVEKEEIKKDIEIYLGKLPQKETDDKKIRPREELSPPERPIEVPRVPIF
jgi:hypothetical protein